MKIVQPIDIICRVSNYLERSRHNPVDAYQTRQFDFPAYPGDGFPGSLLVFGGECRKPHFHVLMSGALLTSIRLDAPEYYFHGESRRFLSEEQRDRLVGILTSDPYKTGFIRDLGRREYTSVWQWLAYNWICDERNDFHYVDWKSGIVPDYSKLETRDYIRKRADNHRRWINF